ncbi:MAG: hypothetical protein A2V98_03300 [Planctomycetes bacterium RBG_16_64_12]|nr:MAG: hypothetical protein A2V98_03300 [Planctomycetes bacterium RBG_16_64_12]
MPSLTVAVPHALGRQEATGRLKEQFDHVKGRFGNEVSDLVQQWDGDLLSFGFKTFGIRIQGTVASGESEVKVTAELPYAAMLFRGAIEKQVRGELEKILA